MSAVVVAAIGLVAAVTAVPVAAVAAVVVAAVVVAAPAMAPEKAVFGGPIMVWRPDLRSQFGGPTFVGTFAGGHTWQRMLCPASGAPHDGLGAPGAAVIGRHWRPRSLSGRARAGSWRKSVRGAMVGKLETREKGGKTRETKTGKTCGQILQICWQVLRTAVCPSLSSKTCGQNLQNSPGNQRNPKASVDARARIHAPLQKTRQARPRKIAEAGGGVRWGTRRTRG